MRFLIHTDPSGGTAWLIETPDGPRVVLQLRAGGPDHPLDDSDLPEVWARHLVSQWASCPERTADELAVAARFLKVPR